MCFYWKDRGGLSHQVLSFYFLTKVLISQTIMNLNDDSCKRHLGHWATNHPYHLKTGLTIAATESLGLGRALAFITMSSLGLIYEVEALTSAFHHLILSSWYCLVLFIVLPCCALSPLAPRPTWPRPYWAGSSPIFEPRPRPDPALIIFIRYQFNS